VIEARELTKRYGDVVAVDGLSFDVLPGRVTGFLGPNGAGKSTTMRLILGLTAPDRGTVTVDGTPYRQHRLPLHVAGALLEAKSWHPGRSAYNHLWCLAQTNGIPCPRVGEVLDLVGLSHVAGKRAGTFSLGMSQRLGIATALLGDPGTLLLDEPVNGLDPEGILWVRTLLRSLAAAGKAIFVSSHLMSEMSQTADQLVVVGRGRLIANCSVAEFLNLHSKGTVRVRSPQQSELAGVLTRAHAAVTPEPDGALAVAGLTTAEVGELAARHNIPLHELVGVRASLEEVFMELTRDSVDFHAGASP
jgi:ABC-2 type transport system ATP-binding protein